jgi:hypothetical protein
MGFDLELWDKAHSVCENFGRFWQGGPFIELFPGEQKAARVILELELDFGGYPGVI